MNKVKQFTLLLVALNVASLFSHTTKIVTLKKDDKRIVLIGDIHIPHKHLKVQDIFFKTLIKKLDTDKPEKTMFFYEAIRDPNNYPLLKPYQDNIHIFDQFKTYIGKALSKVRFFEQKRKFKVQNFDCRTLQELQELVYEINLSSLSQQVNTKINDFIMNIPDNKQALYRKKIAERNKECINGNTDQENLLYAMNTTSDLYFMELLEKEIQKHNLFFVHAGEAHTDLMKEFLTIERWETIDIIESTDPQTWKTDDKKLKPFFLHEKPPSREEEGWVIINSSTDEDSDNEIGLN